MDRTTLSMTFDKRLREWLRLPARLNAPSACDSEQWAIRGKIQPLINAHALAQFNCLSESKLRSVVEKIDR